jgi:hypothetical protein
MELRELNFGIEIETVKRTREVVAKAIQMAVGGEVRHVGTPSHYDPWEVKDARGRVWKVVADGSLINVPFSLRAELVSPVLTYEDLPLLQEVVRAVRTCGAKVDDRCGIHVHVDASAFRKSYTKPVSDELIAKIEQSRPKTKDQLNRIWYGFHNQQPQHFDSTRYYV